MVCSLSGEDDVWGGAEVSEVSKLAGILSATLS